MLSSGLEKIILKCTQADPNDRYQNCTELMYALEHYDELDDSYRKKNKKKLGLFAATVALAVVSGITAGIGYSGMQRIKLNNYNQYIENGMNYCREENYEPERQNSRKQSNWMARRKKLTSSTYRHTLMLRTRRRKPERNLR